ncbi:hypothetical protein ACS0TY_017713 [Phlomoides rotata]
MAIDPYEDEITEVVDEGSDGVDVVEGCLMDGTSDATRGGRGRKSGYLTILENNLGAKFPSTDLKRESHINSKIHVWKRQYVCLKNMLGISGVGLNSTTYHVKALPEVWESQIKMDVDDDGESHAAADNTTTDKTSFSVDENISAPIQNQKGTK